MADVESVRAAALVCAVFLRRRQHRKKMRMPAMATAANTPTTIPAIVPPNSIALPPVLSGSLVAEEELAASVVPLVDVTVADEGVEEVETVADVDKVDADDVVVEEKAIVLFVTLKD